MKLQSICVALLAMAALAVSAHADILLNGDFSDGKTHWHGDGDVPDPGGKLVVTLKPDKWTVIYQEFSSEAPVLKLEVSYSYSDDCTLAHTDPGAPPTPPLTSTALEQATGLANRIPNLDPGSGTSWMVLMTSGGRIRGGHNVRSNDVGATPGLFTTTLSEGKHQFNADDLCLAFPPGKGTVTITSVKLIPPAN